MPELKPEEKTIIDCRKKYGVDILKVSLASKIPESLLAAICCQESYPKLYKQSVRFEEHIFNELYSKKVLNGIDVLQASSSHGLCQVMGFYVKAYKPLGKSKYLGSAGVLDLTIQDLYEKPFESCALHLQKVACVMGYIEKNDFESVARVYNGGSPTNKTKAVTGYWLNIQKYMALYDEIKKIPVEELPK